MTSTRGSALGGTALRATGTRGAAPRRTRGRSGGWGPTHRAAPGVLALALALGFGLAAGGCSSDGSNPPSADVRITSCTRDADSHRAVVRGEVRNHSSKRSNYLVNVDVKANDSKIESGFASVLTVEPDESKAFTIRALGADVPSNTDLTCTVAHVGRVVAE